MLLPPAITGLALGWLYGMAVVMAVLGALFDPAMQSTVSGLTSTPAEMRVFNTWLDGTGRLARVASSGLIGVIAALLPIEQFFSLDAISFLVSIATLQRVGRFSAPAAARRRVDLAGWLGDLRIATAQLRGSAWLQFNLWDTAVGNAGWYGGVIVALLLLL